MLSKRFGSPSDYIRPGWNELAKYKHSLAREAHLKQVQIGKPRLGPEYLS
jgi:hypothetical protein